MPLLLVQTIIGSWDKASGVGKNGTSALSRNVAENELATSYTAFNLAYKVRKGGGRKGRAVLVPTSSFPCIFVCVLFIILCM